MTSTRESRTALISGASIAGPTLAYWLSRYGWDVTVVERAPEPRTAGQNIDVRGAGVTVLERMGLREAVASRRTGEQGICFIGPDGRAAGCFPADGTDIDGATAEFEILRGDLSSLLTGAAAAGVTYVYGDQIASVTDDANGARAVMASGAEHHVDVVIAADGLNSTTRDLLGLHAPIRWIGEECTYFTIPRAAADNDYWCWYNAGSGRSVHLRPDPYGGIRAVLCQIVPATDAAAATRRSREEQIVHLDRLFAGAGWHTDRVLAGMKDAEDLYYEFLGQVRAPQWFRGRTVLAGDAAHAASPLSGMGTTLALTGAYVLAGELARHDGHDDLTPAFTAYERRMRPFVEQAQKLPPFGPRLTTPQTRLGVKSFATLTKIVASPALRRLGDRFSSRPADAIDLPDYSRLVH